MNSQEERDAHDLFVRFDGSLFYMSRDGLEDAYLAHNVPKELEAQWMEELTLQRVGELGLEGNWRAVHFLNHHADYRHTKAVLSATPRGVLWQRCAFLEEQLTYLKNSLVVGLVPPAAAQSALECVIRNASAVRQENDTVAFRDRVDRIVQAAESLRRDKRTRQ